VSLLPHFIGQSKSQGQPTFKEKKKKYQHLMNVVTKFLCRQNTKFFWDVYFRFYFKILCKMYDTIMTTLGGNLPE
jgi:hypothetical protein